MHEISLGSVVKIENTIYDFLLTMKCIFIVVFYFIINVRNIDRTNALLDKGSFKVSMNFTPDQLDREQMKR